MSWGAVNLGELIEIKHGFAFKGAHFSDSGTYILLTPGNCHESGGLKLKGEKEKYYTGEIPEDYLLSSGDLLVVMTDLVNTAPILGGSFLIPEGDKFLHNQRLGLVCIKNEKKINKKFLYYLLNTSSYRGQVRGSASGATVRHTSPERIKRCEVSIPSSVTEQKFIASILSAYDDLIENNRRRIQLLEQAARLLCKEWFVHLRFPGHEHVKIKSGVPEGWEEGCVGDLASVKSGYAFKSSDWQPEGNPVIKIKNIAGDGTVDTTIRDYISDTVAEKAARFVIPVGALIIAMTGATVGKVGILSDSSRAYYLNQRVGLFKSRSGDPIERYLFPFFQEGIAQTQVINLAGGAAQPNISGGQIESIQLLIPDKKIFNLYLETTKAAFQQRQILLEQDEKLIQARDLLLPRLMSGELAA